MTASLMLAGLVLLVLGVDRIANAVFPTPGRQAPRHRRRSLVIGLTATLWAVVLVALALTDAA